MKNLVIYSSKTGNTKKVAEAIAENYKFDITSVNDLRLDSIDDYDNLIIGFWVDKGTADKDTLELFNNIENKNIGLFLTLGAYPTSEHAKNSMKTCEDILIKKGNKIIATFMCQGKIDAKLTEMFMSMGKDSPHRMDEERIKRHKEAEKHPDEKDLEDAVKAFEGLA